MSEQKKSAWLVKELSCGPTAAGRASQRLYLLEDGEHVVVSAATILGQPETYIFAADSEGEITDWIERNGSYRGGLDHEEALRRAGYVVEGST